MSDEPNLNISPAPRNEKPASHAAEPPPLSLTHLYLFVACVSIYLAITRGHFKSAPGVVGLAILIATAVMAGIAWSGLAIWITRRIRGVPWLVEPGEWLLVVTGIGIAAEVAMLNLSPMRSYGVAVSLETCALLLPVLSPSLPRGWKALFFVSLIGHLSIVVRFTGIDMPPFVLTLTRGVGLGILIVNLLNDRQWKVRRNWLHWTGVVHSIVYSFVPPVFRAIQLLLF